MDTPGRIAELERKFAENPRRYFAALANEFRKHGDLEHAIELCEAHLAEQRNHLSGHVVLAQALVDAGRESEAWDSLHTALDLDPENFIALRLIGELSARVGDVDQARTYFFRALEIEPRNENLLTAVKNLSQRTVPAAETTAPPEPAALEPTAPPEPAVLEPTAAQPLDPQSWGDVAPLAGLEGTSAFEAEAAAEPVAEEPPPELAGAERPGAAGAMESDMLAAAESGTAGEVVSEELHGEPQFTDELPLLEPLEPLEEDVVEPAAEEAAGVETAEEVLRGPVEAADSQQESAVVQSPDSAFADWLPPADTVPEPTPGDDWISAAGSVPTEASDWDIAAGVPEAETSAATGYEHHDWRPPLESSPESVRDQATGAAAEPPDATQAGEVAPAAFVPGESPQPAEGGGPEPDARPALVSETMADLYLQQGHVTLAADVLRELVAARPGDERLRTRLTELEQKAAVVLPRQTVRDMFAKFARTAQPMRGRPQPESSEPAPAAHAEAGPLARFLASVPSSAPLRDDRADALLAMLSPADPAPAEDDRPGQWLAALRG